MTDRGFLNGARAGYLLALALFLGAGMALVLSGAAQAASAPTITSISPSEGSARGGTPVTVTGTGFQVGVKLYIGGLEASGVTRVSSTQITATTAASDGGSGRSATVRVVNPDGGVASLNAGFFFTTTSQTPLALTSVAASSGPNLGGTAVTITGGGFNSSASVYFGGIPAEGVQILGASAIFARTPANVSGPVDVTVTNPDGESITLDDAFTYTGGVTLSSIAPGGGTPSGGSTVRVNGNGFERGATVTIGGAQATDVIYVNSTQLVAVTPPGTTGPKPVTVTNPGGTSAAIAQGFNYGPGPNSVAPTVSGVSPATGLSLGGTQVTVNGTGFSGGAVVYFGDVPSPSVSWNGPSSLFARTPSNVSGPVAVRVVNNDGGSATLANAFTFEGGNGLSLSSVVPASVTAAGGTPVVVNGNGINPGSWVTFNGVPAPTSTVIGSTQIAAVTPPGLSGTVTVGVTQVGGLGASLAGGLTVTGTSPGTPTPPPPAAGGTGAFLAPPVFSASGQALVIFGGGSTAQLEAAASAVQATGVWLQDGTGAYQLLVVGGPAFLKEAFEARFPAGIGGSTPMTLTR